MKKKEILIRWLQDAYAMEKAVIKTLEEHAHDFKEIPEIRSAIEKHIDVSKVHADKVKNCLQGFQADTSDVKTGFSSFLGTLQGMSTEIVDEKLIKNVMAEYVSENAEIAMYRKIMAAADECGENKVFQMCEEIMQDEEEMADFLIESVEPVVIDYLNSKEN